jgi:hypothetical protein
MQRGVASSASAVSFLFIPSSIGGPDRTNRSLRPDAPGPGHLSADGGGVAAVAEAAAER